MSMFQLYLQLGFYHIADLAGYDHILFLVALSAVYLFRHWKRVLVLVTAFTLGHTVTLVLASLDYLFIPTMWVEFLIPLTILITAISNIFNREANTKGIFQKLKYLVAMVFGLIHGLGFSSYLKSMLGSEESLVSSLLAFNIGLEIGQIAIVMCILAASSLSVGIFKVKQREWNLILSGGAMGVSVILLIERFPF